MTALDIQLLMTARVSVLVLVALIVSRGGEALDGHVGAELGDVEAELGR